MELNIPQAVLPRPVISIIPGILVDERATVQVRYAKLLVFSGVLCSAFAALVLLNYPFAKSTFFQQLLGILLIIGAWAGLAYALRAFYRLFRYSRYIPGESFPFMRGSNARIAMFYRACFWVGVILLPSIILIAILREPKIMMVLQGLATALGLIALGHYGRIAKDAHADIDHVAVHALRSVGLLNNEKVYAAHQNFDPTATYRKHDDHAVFGVLADGIVLLFADATGWHHAKKPFTDLTEIGIDYKKSEAIYLLRFVDGSKYTIKIDMESLSTEVLTFTRQFLSALDDAVTGSVRKSERVGRRRIITAQTMPAEVATVAVSSPGRQIEFDRNFITEASAAVPTPGGRVIELLF